MLETVGRTVRRATLAALALIGLAACFLGSASRPAPAATLAPEARGIGRPTPPADSVGQRALREAARVRGLKILVSTEDRWLWLVMGRDTVMSVPVAVGRSESFSYGGRSWYFSTPKGHRRVLSKEVDPVWTVPDWQYYEQAASRNLKVVAVQPGRRYDISDGYIRYVEMRDGRVGWVNVRGNFYAPDGQHYIEFGGKLFMPPSGGPQRKVPGALGPYALDLGDGYLLHGTNDFDANSIGQAVSHGCVRLDNAVLERLYQLVPTGTPVYIF